MLRSGAEMWRWNVVLTARESLEKHVGGLTGNLGKSETRCTAVTRGASERGRSCDDLAYKRTRSLSEAGHVRQKAHSKRRRKADKAWSVKMAFDSAARERQPEEDAYPYQQRMS